MDPFQVAVRCDKDDCCENEALEVGGYNHPVIVLSVNKQPSSNNSSDLVCRVACVTTYSKTTLDEYLAKRPKRKDLRRSLPIKDPDARHLVSQGIALPEELELERFQRLRKQSYVRLGHSYEVPASMLRHYGFYKCEAHKLRLNQTSYMTLMKVLNLPAEDWRTTKSVRKASKQQPTLLASPAEILDDVFTTPPHPTVTTLIYNPYECSPPPPYIATPHIYRPDTSIPAREYTAVPARTYPNYQPYPNAHGYYGSSGPSWSIPEPQEEESSGGLWFFGVIGVLVVGALAWCRYFW